MVGYLLFAYAISIHLSMLAFLPMLFIQKVALRHVKIIFWCYLAVVLLYAVDMLSYFSMTMLEIFATLNLPLRSLLLDNGYVLGVTPLKLIATALPPVFYWLLKLGRGSDFKLADSVWIFCVYFGVLGMLMSGLPYNDRVLIVSWSFAPFLLVSCGNLLFCKIHKSN